MSMPPASAAQSTRCCSEKSSSLFTPLAMFSAASNTDSVEKAQQLPHAPWLRGTAMYSFQLHAVIEGEQFASPTIGSNGSPATDELLPSGAASDASGVIAGGFLRP